VEKTVEIQQDAGAGDYFPMFGSFLWRHEATKPVLNKGFFWFG
jgi:hypothetical protein